SGLPAQVAALRARLFGGDSGGRLAIAAVVVVLGLVAALGGWWFGVGRYTTAPELVSMSKAEAESQASQGGFTVRYAEPRHDGEVPRDGVLAQEPASAARILKGGTLTLTLSLGPDRFPMPDVVGKDFDLAEADLANAQLEVVKGAARFDDGLPEGMVVATKPEAGEEVKPGQEITVFLSKGRAPITVPNLVGKSLNEARGIIGQLGLVLVEPTYKDSDKPRDEVLGQSPADGSGVEKGAQVRLEVSKGPPQVTVPRVVDLPCQQAKQVLESQGFQVSVQFNPNAVARFQNPSENAQVPPGSQITIGCF
ncbi:PASTA domain-containing protein, partial [Verrucosispora sp. SN26_14.1]